MRKVLFLLSVSILFFMPILKADTQSSPKKINKYGLENLYNKTNSIAPKF